MNELILINIEYLLIPILLLLITIVFKLFFRKNDDDVEDKSVELLLLTGFCLWSFGVGLIRHYGSNPYANFSFILITVLFIVLLIACIYLLIKIKNAKSDNCTDNLFQQLKILIISNKTSFLTLIFMLILINILGVFFSEKIHLSEIFFFLICIIVTGITITVTSLIISLNTIYKLFEKRYQEFFNNAYDDFDKGRNVNSIKKFKLLLKIVKTDHGVKISSYTNIAQAFNKLKDEKNTIKNINAAIRYRKKHKIAKIYEVQLNNLKNKFLAEYSNK